MKRAICKAILSLMSGRIYYGQEEVGLLGRLLYPVYAWASHQAIRPFRGNR